MSDPYSPPTPTPPPGPVPWPPPITLGPGQPLSAEADIQGNVLAGFNKDHQIFLMLAFPSGTGLAQAWLAELVPQVATNAAVASYNERFSMKRRAGGRDPADMNAVWTNVSFTATGVATLSAGSLDPLSSRADLDLGIKAWIAGAGDDTTLQAIGDVGTNASTGWVFGGPASRIDAIVCLAADTREDLETAVSRERSRAARHQLTITFEQDGATLPEHAAGHEHFGFKDGISQPGVTGFDVPDPDPVRAGEVLGKPGTDLIAPGTFVVGYERDGIGPVPAPKWMFNGSFLVTRRLAQDVPGFWAGVETQFATQFATAPASGIGSPDALAAKLVGRWRSGTPTDHAPLVDNRASQDPAADNDFDFADDLPGVKTPACAHIRKVYPRAGATPAVTEDDTKQRRIIRRGIPFGQPFQPTAGRGEGVDAERGLVFQCYQASIADGFIFLQQTWVNNPDFPTAATGRDAVIGLATDVTIPTASQPISAHFAQFVQTQGSVFSFTPSLSTLGLLAAGQPLPFT